MNVKATLMEETAVRRSLMRIAHEIIERNKGAKDVCILGIKSRGAELGKIIALNIGTIEGVSVPFAELDIRHYRDDLEKGSGPVLDKTSLPFSIRLFAIAEERKVFPRPQLPQKRRFSVAESKFFT